MNGFLKVSLPTFMTLMQRDCQISSAFNLKKVSLLYSCKKQQGPSFFYEAQLDSFQFSSSKLEIGQTSDWLESAESQMSELDSCNQKKSTGNIGFKKCCYQKTSTELPNSEWAANSLAASFHSSKLHSVMNILLKPDIRSWLYLTGKFHWGFGTKYLCQNFH